MEEQSRNVISSEKFTRYNISYPVIVKGWEITRGEDFAQRNLYIQFQKISNELLAFKINVTCLTAFDEIIQTISDISIKEVNNKKVNFFECIPLAPNTEKVNVTLMQYVLSDATIGPTDCKNEIIDYEFKRFEDVEDEKAGERLLSSAKGYPIEKGSYWYCACGRINWQRSHTCVACHNDKKQVFSKITAKAIEREKVALKADEIKEEEYARSTHRNKIMLISVGSVLAIIAIIIFILFATVLPAPTVTVDGLKYKKNSNGTYTVIKCKTDEENITIPSEIRGIKVTEIGQNAFYDNDNLKSVTISEGITRISNCAFCKCYYLRNVSLPNSIKIIDAQAFYFCIRLTELVIPTGIEFIGAFAIESDVTILCSANRWPMSWSRFSSNIYSSNIIWNYRAHGETENGLKWARLNTSEITIYNYVDGFINGNSGSSKDVTIPATINGYEVTKIWKSAFESKFLTSIKLPDTIKYIGDEAFRNNKDITKIIIPTSVTDMGSYIFENCDNLTIYCEASKSSEQWDWNWNNIDTSNATYAPVVWGYTGE